MENLDAIREQFRAINKKRTNADRIRAMSDEELAELWWERVDCGECPVHKECKLTGQDCKRLVLNWLKKEATDVN